MRITAWAVHGAAGPRGRSIWIPSNRPYGERVGPRAFGVGMDSVLRTPKANHPFTRQPGILARAIIPDSGSGYVGPEDRLPDPGASTTRGYVEKISVASWRTSCGSQQVGK